MFTNDWENPKVFGINKEPAAATLMPYATRAAALRRDRMASTFCKLLNGEWRFRWYPNPGAVTPGFEAVDAALSDWETIPVPSNWEMMGDILHGKEKVFKTPGVVKAFIHHNFKTGVAHQSSQTFNVIRH